MSSQSLRVLFTWILLLRTVVSIPQATPSPTNGVALALVTAEPVSLAAPSATADPSCNACYIVADGVGLVWYSEVFINTAATALVNIATGNGTGRSTGTTLFQNNNHFTFNPGKTDATGGLALTTGAVVYDSTLIISGASLSSPTAYNVFSAYSITSEYISDGQCATFSGSRTSLSSYYSTALPTTSGRVVLDGEGQQEFANYLGFSTCSGVGGGQSVAAGALIPVSNTTMTTTQYVTGLALSAASMTLAPTTIGTITASPGGVTTLSNVVSTAAVTLSTSKASEATASSGTLKASEAATSAGTSNVLEVLGNSTSTSTKTTTSYPFASAPIIIIGSSTITPYGNPINLPFYTPPTGTSAGPGVVTLSLPSASVGTGVVVVIPSGTGGGNYTATIVPYSSTAASWRRDHIWMSLWAVGLAGLGVVICWL